MPSTSHFSKISPLPTTLHDPTIVSAIPLPHRPCSTTADAVFKHRPVSGCHDGRIVSTSSDFNMSFPLRSYLTPLSKEERSNATHGVSYP